MVAVIQMNIMIIYIINRRPMNIKKFNKRLNFFLINLFIYIFYIYTSGWSSFACINSNSAMDDAPLTLPIFSSVILLLFCLPLSSSSASFSDEVKSMLQIERLVLTTTVGPESLTFDRLGRGPYTGVSDGRILLWHGHSNGWTTFAVNSANK